MSRTGMSERICQAPDCGKSIAHLLHLGDFDPSGVSIFERVATDVAAFLEEDAPDVAFEGVRVALTEEQIDEHKLPMDPITTKDSRSLAWAKQGRTEKCELEALTPDVIVDHLDRETYSDRLAQEVEELAILKSLPSVISMVTTFSPRLRRREFAEEL